MVPGGDRVGARAPPPDRGASTGRPARRDRRRGSTTFHHAMAVPLLGESGLIGSMVIANRLTEGTRFGEDDLRLLETLANQAAVALENGQLEQSLRELSRLKEELRYQAYHDPLTGLGQPHAVRRTASTRRWTSATTTGSPWCCSSTSTTSRTSTTAWATRPATGCWSRSPSGSARASGRTTWPPGSGATSSRSCSSDGDRPRGRSLAVANRVDRGAHHHVPDPGPGPQDLRQHRDRRADAATRSGPTTCCATPTSRCTRPSRAARAGSRCSSRRCTPRSSPATSLSTELSRGIGERRDRRLLPAASSRSRPASRTGPRRWPAGATRPAASIAPEEFIPLAEESGAILELGRAVLFEACREAADLADRTSAGPLTVTVNLSAAQLARGHASCRTSWTSCGRPACRPTRLVLEMTETAMFHDTQTTIARLDRAARPRCPGRASTTSAPATRRWGTCAGSRSTCSRSRASSCRRRPPAPTSWAFANAIVALGRTLGLRIVAEGIEEQGQLEQLRDAGLRAGAGVPVRAADAGEEVAARFADAGRARHGSRRPSHRPAAAFAAGGLTVFILYAVVLGVVVGLLAGGRTDGPRADPDPLAGADRRRAAGQVVLFCAAVAERVATWARPCTCASTRPSWSGRRAPQLAIPGIRSWSRARLQPRRGRSPTAATCPRRRGPRRVRQGGSDRSTPTARSCPTPPCGRSPTSSRCRRWLPAANVFSVGDVLIGLGIVTVIVVAHATAGGRARRFGRLRRGRRGCRHRERPPTRAVRRRTDPSVGPPRDLRVVGQPYRGSTCRPT